MQRKAALLCFTVWCIPYLNVNPTVIVYIFRMRVKKLPHILALHLKRFKYVDQLSRHTKLSYRVVFPLELRLFNTVSLKLINDFISQVSHILVNFVNFS